MCARTDRATAKSAIDVLLVMYLCNADDLKMLRNDADTENRIIRSPKVPTADFVGEFQVPYVRGVCERYSELALGWLEGTVPSYFEKVSLVRWVPVYMGEGGGGPGPGPGAWQVTGYCCAAPPPRLPWRYKKSRRLARRCCLSLPALRC